MCTCEDIQFVLDAVAASLHVNIHYYRRVLIAEDVMEGDGRWAESPRRSCSPLLEGNPET